MAIILGQNEINAINKIKELNVRIAKYMELVAKDSTIEKNVKYTNAINQIYEDKLSYMGLVVKGLNIDYDHTLGYDIFRKYWKKYPVFNFAFIEKGTFPKDVNDFVNVIGQKGELKTLWGLKSVQEFEERRIRVKTENDYDHILIRLNESSPESKWNEIPTGKFWEGKILRESQFGYLVEFQGEGYHFQKWINQSWNRSMGYATKNGVAKTLQEYSMPHYEKLKKNYTELFIK